MKNLLIIGGSDAGISAALRAKEVDPSIRVTVIEADQYPNYSICGLPFFLSGEVEDWRTLAHRTVEEIERASIHLLLNHKAEAVDPDAKIVRVRSNPFSAISQRRFLKIIFTTPSFPARLCGESSSFWMPDQVRHDETTKSID